MELGIGKRIKKRRTDLELTQDDLARRMGYKSKAAICKVENGEDNVTLDRISKFAQALECTPAYLMGWEDITDANGVEIMVKAPDYTAQLTSNEIILIEAYREDQSFKDMINRLLIYAGKIGEKDA